MSELLSRFIFQESKLTSQVWLVALLVWMLVLACTVSSVLTQPFSRRQRILWICLLIGLPIIGLLAYLPFSIRRDELPTAFLIRGTAKGRKQPLSRLPVRPASRP